jgi:ribosome biogenesis GTPase A
LFAGNRVELLQVAPFGDPLYLNINGSRCNTVETAREIEVEILKPIYNDQSKHQCCFNGNPNTGKTSVFNQLTGLNQQVGNYPELRLKKIGFCKLPNNAKANILDLPHTA